MDSDEIQTPRSSPERAQPAKAACIMHWTVPSTGRRASRRIGKGELEGFVKAAWDIGAWDIRLEKAE